MDISMVGKLMTLEVLSVNGTHLEELSRDLGNLTNLRVLDIVGGRIVKIPSKLISRLHSLEELYLECEFWEWSKVDEEGDETNADFDEVTGLSKLRILHVRISNEECIPKHVEFIPKWVEFFICIGRDESWPPISYDPYQYGGNQRTICLKLDSISNLPDWFFNAVMNKAEKLVWYECPRTGIVDVFVEYECGRLHRLKNLTVWGTFNDDELMNTSTWVPKEPVVENLGGLKPCNVELRAVEFLPPMSLSNVKFLTVGCCYNQGIVLFPSTLLERPSNLGELRCEDMNEVEYVFGCEALLETEQSKLREIVLLELQRVRSLCEGPVPPTMFQNLQSLSTTDCSKLEGSLFTYDVALCLSQLKYCTLHKCPMLERIVEASNKKIILPKLKQLSLWLLPILYYDTATFDMECPSLEELYLCYCPKFSVSFVTSTAQNKSSYSQLRISHPHSNQNLASVELLSEIRRKNVGSERVSYGS